MTVAAPIAKELVEDILKLTPMQESMLFHYLNGDHSHIYCEQTGIGIDGTVDIGCFISAWRAVTAANEPLRSVIRWNTEHKAALIIKREHEIPIVESDLTGVMPGGLEDRLRELRERSLNDRIDIREAPFRVHLIKLAENRYELLIEYHHAILDGWSFGVILQEFASSYESALRGSKIHIERKTPNRAYIQWLSKQDRQAGESYWRSYLSGINQRSRIPGDRPRLVGGSFIPASVACAFGKPLSERVKRYSGEVGITAASLLYSAWGALLQKYNNSNDVVFGVTVSGRPPEISGIERMTGMFILSVPLRLTSSPRQSALDYVLQAASALPGVESSAVLPAREFSSYMEAGEGELPFDSVVVVKNYPLDRGLSDSSGKLHYKKTHVHEETNFELTLQISLHDEIDVDFHYNAEVYDRSTIERLAKLYLMTIDGLIGLGSRPLMELQLVSEAEREEIGRLFHATEAEIPAGRIEDLVWAQADRTPNKTAVRFEGDSLTYGQLRQEAERIAGLLKGSGIEPSARVALLISRSAAMVAAVLGILEAGCICVPLDPGHPEERTRAILEDCGAVALLAGEEANTSGYHGIVLPLSRQYAEPGCDGSTVIRLQDEASAGLRAGENRKAEASDTAYLIYTSGSTGAPKGAMLHHGGIVNHAFAKINDVGIGQHDIVGSSFSVSVVASIWQLLAPLFVGAELVVYSADVERDPLEQFKRIEADGVTVIELIPSVLNAYVRLLETGYSPIPLRGLRSIVLTSEETKPGLVNRFYGLYGDIQLINAYGQTECCDDTLHYPIPRTVATERIPIGRPVFNTRPYIVDFNGSLQPMGMPGELIVAGAGVSRGYWNRPELNGQKYIEHPLEQGVVMYRTGDLAAWLPDGTIRYMGRVDHQVKIRGNRIELSEVENGIARMNEVREAAVIVRPNGREEDALWAFFTAERPLTAVEIRTFLQKSMPLYMIPERLVQIETMPLMPNGKINRHALRTLEAETVSAGGAAASPENETERRIMEIWREVLRKDLLGASDTFFDSGGNSLLVLQLAARLNQSFGVQLTVAELFAHATIRKQAERILTLSSTSKEPVAEAIRSVYIPAGNSTAGDALHSYGETLRLETKMPASVWTSLAKADQRKPVRAGEAAFAALGLLLSKLSDQQNITVYAFRPEDGRIKPVDYDFDRIGGISDLVSALGNEDGKWLDPQTMMLPLKNSGTDSIRALMYERRGSSGPGALSSMFNLQVEWNESGSGGTAVLSWRLEQSAYPDTIVREWIGAHAKLTAYVAEELASQTMNAGRLS